MAEMQITAVGKIIEGALENDIEKVKAYAEHIAKQFELRNEHSSAQFIRTKIDGTYKNKIQIILD